MTTYYVGKGGNDSNAGTSWAQRKLTLNGAEDIPVAAGDKVYVGPGVYREKLICDVSGGSTYSTGTVSVTKGSKTVTGSGTTFGGNVSAGDLFHILRYDNGSDGVTDGTSTFTAAGGNFHANLVGCPIQINSKAAYVISAVASSTSLTLSDPNSMGWPTAGSSLTYSIMTGQGHYEVESQDSNTQLTLTEPWGGKTHSGLSYLTFTPITYIGDQLGEHTDGVGGIVRITGSDNDQTATRDRCIELSADDYRVFRGFHLDTTTSSTFDLYNLNDVVIEDCVFTGWASSYGASVTKVTFRNSIVIGPELYDSGIYGAAVLNDSGWVFENVLFIGSGRAVRMSSAGGVTVRNCSFVNSPQIAISYLSPPMDGQVLHVINCTFQHCNRAVSVGAVSGDLIEDYNNYWENYADRTNVGTGANSTAYPTLWALPLMVKGYKFPWTIGALSEWSEIASRAGLDEPSVDMYGLVRPTTSAKKSWGAIQFHDAERDTGTTYDSSTASIKLADAGVHQMFVPVSNESTTISVRVYREANYAGTNPRMVIKQPGQSDRVTTDTGSVSTWNLLTDTFTPSADTEFVVVELQSLNTATSGSYDVFFDALSVN